MLRVTVELVPYGDESLASVISQGIIYNDGTSNKNDTYGNYVGNFMLDGQKYSATIRNFPRHYRCLSLLRSLLNKIEFKPFNGDNMETR